MIKVDQIEEYAGRRRFFITFPKSSFFEYEKRMLKESGCPYTLPMHFISEEEKLKASYDFTELITLDDYIIKKRSDLMTERKSQQLLFDSLEVVTNILNTIRGMENYLLFPGRVKIEIDTVFIHPDSRKAAVAFIPAREQERSLQVRVIQMIEGIKQLYQLQETNQYLDQFIKTVQGKNLGLDGMINVLGEIQREISYIYWDTNNFRTVGERELQEADPINKAEEASEEKENTYMRSKFNLKMKILMKPLILQFVLFTALIAVYILGTLEIESFAGLSLITAGTDLWLIKKMLVLKGPKP
ncbi:MAG: DUF6382 domain-containing protein [Bacillota bacterium]